MEFVSKDFPNIYKEFDKEKQTLTFADVKLTRKTGYKTEQRYNPQKYYSYYGGYSGGYESVQVPYEYDDLEETPTIYKINKDIANILGDSGNASIVNDINQNNILRDAKSNSLGFYIINVAAANTEQQAKNKMKELKNQGYNAGYLWIPDYASLSGAQLYCVYIGPFKSQYECEVATEEYRKKDSKAYGLLVSNESTSRVQILGIGKVSKR